MPFSEILLLENPRGRGWYGEPYRHRVAAQRGRRLKNPMTNALAMPKSLKGFYQGVSPMDAGLALGGFAAATMVPGMIVKDVSTTGKKVLKLIVALGMTGVVGMIAKSVGKDAGAKAAIAGGLAGSLAQALGMFAGVQIGQRAIGRGMSHVTRIGEPVTQPFRSDADSMIITSVT